MKTNVTNFGGNQTWQATYFKPSSDQEVLDILNDNADRRVRPVGSLHSWSDIAATDSIGLDMTNLNSVEPYEKDGQHFVRVGGGCKLHRLVSQLHSRTDQTMPTLGAITQQSISGAISTGTHGSGKQCLSHFVSSMRVAAYDPETGKARIYEYKDGDELKAARVGLGCAGVILSLDLKTVPKYNISETVVRKGSVQEVLETYQEHPLSQFTLFPHGWDILAWERKAMPSTERTLGQKIKAKMMHALNLAAVDVGYHAALKGLVWLGSPALLKTFSKLSPSLLLKNVERVDESTKVLTLKHHLFQHEEMEVFVPQSRLPEAVEVVKYATQVCAGENVAAPPGVEKKLRELGMYDELQGLKGSYTHHYPFYFRKVLPDDTLISMTASKDEPSFSMSLFNYNAPEDRGEYYKYCDWTARCLNKLCGARLHWGKHFPLKEESVAPTYPEMDKFKAICEKTDPNGVFRNSYTQRVLGF